MTDLLNKTLAFTLGLLLPCGALFPAHAEDTEVLFSGGAKPNVLFILDTSSSMRSRINNSEGVSSFRFAHMKDAMRQFIESAQDMNIGVMRFNRYGAAVVQPIVDLDKPLTKTLSRIAVTIDDSSDDVEQEGSSSANATNSSIYIGFHNSNTITSGLRFNHINIPAGSTISNAYIEFRASSSYSTTADISITGEASSNPKTFHAFSGDDRRLLQNLSQTKTAVSWPITAPWSSGSFYQSPDLTSIINELITSHGWVNGNSMAFLLKDASGGSEFYRKFYASNTYSGIAPKLVIEFDQPYTLAITGRDALLEATDRIIAASGTPIVGALYEGRQYFSGSDLIAANSRYANTGKHRIYDRVSHPDSYGGGTVSGRLAGCTDDDLDSISCYQEQIDGSPKYISPISKSCQSNNNIILLTDGSASVGLNTANRTAVEDLIGKSCATRSDADEICGNELAEFISTQDQLDDNIVNGDQKINLFTIGFAFSSNWLRDLANIYGNGQYYTANNATDLLSSFSQIFTNILDVDSSFSTVGVTINTFNKLNHRNELYFSLFRPNTKVQWDGNLKHYKLNSAGQVIDANNALAVDNSTGFFKSSSQSFWSATVDGDNVEAGGVAGNLTGPNRNLYSYLGSNTALSAPENHVVTTNASLTNAMFGPTVDDARRIELINFTRGLDANGNNRFRVQDPLHSTPFIVTYGSSNAAADTVVFFGDNQGLLHSINSLDGSENWAFIPQQLLKNQPSLIDNNEHVDGGHIYGLDGNVTGWLQPDQKYLYVGMRRGGTSYYAFDISSKAAPTMLWQITRGAPGFEELGQSWSKPIKTKVKINGTATDVLIFAGGYDPKQDAYTVQTTDSQGRAIYMVNATTGALEWHASSLNSADTTLVDMKYSIPSAIKVIDSDNDSFADQMYVGDMGGQIWRFDIDNSSSQVSDLVSGGVIARLGGTTAANNRRFYHAPDISFINETITTVQGNNTTIKHLTKLAIAVGSGFQAHPLNKVINDRFYLIKTSLDTPTQYNAITESDLLDVTGNSSSIAVDAAALQAKQGWYTRLTNAGEKVLASSRTADHEIWFTTFEPKEQSSDCVVSPGTARLYRVSIVDASPRYKNAIPDDITQAVIDCDSATCTIDDRAMLLKTGTLPPDPTILKINGKKLIAIGSEVKQYDTIKAKSMYWTDKE